MFNQKLKYLFKCADCEMIVSVEIEDEEDLKKVHEDELILDCPCGGKACVLRD